MKLQNESFFNNINTEEKAYWLGFLCADGHAGYSSRRGYGGEFITLDLGSKDKEHLIKFCAIFNSNIRERQKEWKGNIYYTYITRIHNKILFDAIVNYLNNPIILMGYLDNVLLSDFIRGCFDGDGCVDVPKRYWNSIRFSFASPDLNFLEALRDIIRSNIYVDCGYITKNRRNCHQLIFDSNSASFKFYNWIYSDCEIYLKRKKLVFDDFFVEKIASDLL